ncbi:MAG: hypothetical protein ACHQAX_05390 [Gammaproteobacteria bacterium]
MMAHGDEIKELALSEGSSSSSGSASAPHDPAAIKGYVDNPASFLELIKRAPDFPYLTERIVNQLSRTQVRQLLKNAASMNPSLDYELLTLIMQPKYQSRTLPKILASFYAKSNLPIKSDKLNTGSLTYLLMSNRKSDEIIASLVDNNSWELLAEFLLRYEGEINLSKKENSYSDPLYRSIALKREKPPACLRCISILLERIDHELRKNPSNESLLSQRNSLCYGLPIIAGTSSNKSLTSTFQEIIYGQHKFYTHHSPSSLSQAFRTLRRIDRAIIFKMIKPHERKEITEKTENDKENPVKLFIEKLFEDVFNYTTLTRFEWLADLDLTQAIQEGNLDMKIFSKIIGWEMFDALAYLLKPLSTALTAQVLASLTPEAWSTIAEFPEASKNLIECIQDKLLKSTPSEMELLLHSQNQNILALVTKSLGLDKGIELYAKFHAKFDRCEDVSTGNAIKELVAGLQKRHEGVDNITQTPDCLMQRIVSSLASEPATFFALMERNGGLAQAYFKVMSDGIGGMKHNILCEAKQKGLLDQKKYSTFFLKDAYAIGWIKDELINSPAIFIKLMFAHFNDAAYYFDQMDTSNRTQLLHNAQAQGVDLMGRLFALFASGGWEGNADKVGTCENVSDEVFKERFIVRLNSGHVHAHWVYFYLTYSDGGWGMPNVRALYLHNNEDTKKLAELRIYISKETYLRQASSKMLLELFKVPGQKELQLDVKYLKGIISICVGLSAYGSAELKNYFLDNMSVEIRSQLLSTLEKKEGLSPIELEYLEKWLNTDEAQQKLRAPKKEELPPPAYQTSTPTMVDDEHSIQNDEHPIEMNREPLYRPPEPPMVDLEKQSLQEENANLRKQIAELQAARQAEKPSHEGATQAYALPIVTNVSMPVEALFAQIQALQHSLEARHAAQLEAAHEEIGALKDKINQLEGRGATNHPVISNKVFGPPVVVVDADNRRKRSTSLMCKPPYW